MDSIIIIPARGGSKTVPRKNLKNINGKPLIAYAIETAKKTRTKGYVVVSTDDQEIANVSQNYGANIIERPSELAKDEISLPAVIKHAKESLESDGILADRYISLQPTAPLVSVKSLGDAISLHKELGCDSLVSIKLVTHGHPYRIKKFDDSNFKISSFLDVDVFKYPQKQDLPPCYMSTGGFTIRRRKLFGNSDEFYLGNDIRGFLLPETEAIDIDTEEDLNYFRYLIQK